MFRVVENSKQNKKLIMLIGCESSLSLVDNNSHLGVESDECNYYQRLNHAKYPY